MKKNNNKKKKYSGKNMSSDQRREFDRPKSEQRSKTSNQRVREEVEHPRTTDQRPGTTNQNPRTTNPRPKVTEKKTNAEQDPKSPKGSSSSMKLFRKMGGSVNVPVIALLLIAAISLVIMASIYLKDKNANEVEIGDRNVMTVVCPHLVEAGDAFLLYHDGEAVLIDTGVKDDADTILQLLKDYNISNLKAIILTHFDKDHIGSAARILEEVTVDTCYMTIGSEDSKAYEALLDALESTETKEVMLTEKVSFTAADAEFVIYTPQLYEYADSTDNNRSLITEVTYMGQHLLFTGDAKEERITEYLEQQYSGTKFDFLKVPYHGRDGATVQQLLDQFTPSCAVVTSSEEEPESAEVMDALENAGVDSYLTREGTVYMKINENGITIQH